MRFDWMTGVLAVTCILVVVSFIAALYCSLEWRDTRLTIIWVGVFLACVFVLGGFLGGML